MNRNKICPECKAEYLPHIEKCADCGIVLLPPEELNKYREDKERLMQKVVETEVVIREGDLNWMSELYTVLIDADIPCTVRADSSNKKSYRAKYRLMVSPKDAELAREHIEEYFMEMHPEIRASRELVSKGRCPACGSPVGTSDRECSDCGLMLIIIDEEGKKTDPEVEHD